VFDIDTLIGDCRAAVATDEPRQAIREVLTRSLERPTEVAGALQPRVGGITLLHRADDLTVLHVVWAPHMAIYPHDHRMWAAIAIYAGQEDNTFFRRAEATPRALVESGGKQLVERDVQLLGDDVIHSVSNPLDRLTAAIHVYGGDFVAQSRSQWGPGEQLERPYDLGDVERRFADANERWEAASGSPPGRGASSQPS
jgi:predicted metal-dependent enzyme (double-stranded beta helix superfamily)